MKKKTILLYLVVVFLPPHFIFFTNNPLLKKKKYYICRFDAMQILKKEDFNVLHVKEAEKNVAFVVSR